MKKPYRPSQEELDRRERDARMLREEWRKNAVLTRELNDIIRLAGLDARIGVISREEYDDAGNRLSTDD